MNPDIKLFFRNLWREKLYSAITIFGFAFALSFILILSIYIKQELSVDQFHEKKDRIFRATSENSSNFGTLIGAELQNMFPEIESYTRFYTNSGHIVDKDNEKVAFSYLLVDSTFFNIFSFKLIEGNAEEALKTSRSIVLTKSYARKIFGNESALGNEITYSHNPDFKLIVTGVMEDFPNNTHFEKQDGLLNFHFLPDLWSHPGLMKNNDNSSFGLYFLAKPNTDLHSKSSQIVEHFNKDYWLYKNGFNKEFHFEPLTDIYFGGRTSVGAIKSNSKSFVLMLSAIAVVILILSLINYNNLSVARIGNRAKESAIKKLLGTYNSYLFRQIITESIIICYISFVIAIGISLLTFRLFNKLLNTSLALTDAISITNIVLALLVITLLGLIAGLIPAYMITRFKTVDVVKGAFARKSKGIYGKSLIAFQYAVTIVLLIATFVVVKQTHFMKNYDLGFDKENVIILENKIRGDRRTALRSEFEKLPGVVSVSFVRGNPVDGGNNNSFSYNDKALSFQVFEVDSVFFDMMDLKVTPTGVAHSQDAMWINKTAVRELELEDLPQEVTIGKNTTPIVGVVEDFHFNDLNEELGPIMIHPLRENAGAWSIMVKIRGDNLKENFDDVKRIYSQFINGMPFEAEFMDQTINSWYEKNERNAQLVGYFAILTIVLAVMGLLAMASYFMQQRVKEIGVRRVNGAMVGEVFSMLVIDFVKWILVAFVIACPIAWYIMQKWLSDFPYRTEINWWVYGLAGMLALVIAVIIVSWQSVRVATTNPVNTLKSE